MAGPKPDFQIGAMSVILTAREGRFITSMRAQLGALRLKLWILKNFGIELESRKRGLSGAVKRC